MKHYKVIIIGAGPIGMACGIEAKQMGIDHLILEKGCIVNSLFHYPTNMTFFSTSDHLEIGGVPFVSHSDKPTRREALEYYRRVGHSYALNIRSYEEVKSIVKNGSFKVETVKNEYSADYVIIATGFYDKPNLMNIPGEELPKVKHYFTEAHPYAYLNIIVVGAGNSAVDVALETFRRGSKVSLVIRENSLRDNVKYWVRPDIENRIKEGGIKAYFNSELSEVREKSALIRTPEGIIEIENDFVFAMTGYHPDYGFMEKAGIGISGDENKYPEVNPNNFETNIKDLYLAGVVCGGMNTGRFFIENSREHARLIFKNIGKKLENDKNTAE